VTEGVSPLTRALRLAGIFVGLIVAFVLLITLAFALPQGRIIMNLRKSTGLLQSEGLRPYTMMPHRAYELDNFTDGLMLDTAISTQPGGPLYNAMGDFKEVTTNASGAPDPILGLAKSAGGHRDNPAQYADYWHGYQVFLRPALMFFTYGDIRYLNLLLLTSLGAAVLLLLARRAGPRAAVSLALAFALCGFLIVAYSLQFSNMTYVALIASIVVLVKADEAWLKAWGLEFFLAVGMITAFFDLLTTPLMTLGLPLALAIAVLAARNRELAGAKYWASLTGASTLAWGVGYAGAWVTKWVLGELVLKADVIGEAVRQVAFRSGATDKTPQFVSAVVLNVQDLFPMLRARAATSTVVLVSVVVVALLVLLVFWRADISRLKAALPVLAVVPLQYLWYAAASNHSAIHNWFTYRAQVYPVFAILFVLASAIDFERFAKRLGISPVLPSGEGGESVAQTTGR
jgi:hypothetical protein